MTVCQNSDKSGKKAHQLGKYFQQILQSKLKIHLQIFRYNIMEHA